MFFILAACLICWSKSSPVKWGSAVLRDEYDHVQGSKLKKILRLPFGDQLEKYSRQMQIFSHQFV